MDENTTTSALHGEQCGLASVISMYLHGGNWRELLDSLTKLGSPTSFSQFGINRDELVDAIMNAQKIRKNRFSILNSGISKAAAEKLIDITNIE